VNREHVPDAGDLIWLDFDPQAGREQAGRRPAVVLSPAIYNRRSSLALVCPITSQQKGYPFEVALPATLPITGVVLADQVRSLDWRRRHAATAGRAPRAVLQEIREKLSLLLGI
jgi:mRNA interferase MazF